MLEKISNKHLIETDTNSLTLYEQGAHISSWVCDGEEQLFLSEKAIFKTGTALRGGVPICFPQFAAFGNGQKHGFARNVNWLLKDKDEKNMRFTLLSNADSLATWPHDFELLFDIELTDRALEMSLTVKNTGNSPFEFGAALHTYLRTNDVREIQILGLHKQLCWDNGTPFTQRYLDEDEAISVNGPIDRVYFGVEKTLVLKEGTRSRNISKRGFPDVVVWNPWQEDAAQLKDMADDEYLNMICIEAAIVDKQIELNAGASWTGSQSIHLNE